jgi:hypothetical protein
MKKCSRQDSNLQQEGFKPSASAVGPREHGTPVGSRTRYSSFAGKKLQSVSRGMVPPVRVELTLRSSKPRVRIPPLGACVRVVRQRTTPIARLEGSVGIEPTLRVLQTRA